jgi:hypothetical protein
MVLKSKLQIHTTSCSEKPRPPVQKLRLDIRQTERNLYARQDLVRENVLSFQYSMPSRLISVGRVVAFLRQSMGMY